MPEDRDQLYSVNKTTAWFAVSAIVLLVSLVLMVFQDHDREWKRWQRKFIEVEREKVKEDLEKADKAVDQKALEAIHTKLAQAEQAFDQKKSEYDRLGREKEAAGLSLVKARSKYQDLKQYIDSYKFFFEESRAKGHQHETHKYEELIKEINPRLQAAKVEQEEIEKKDEDLTQAVQRLQADQKNSQREMNQMLREKERLERRLKQLAPSVVKEILNSPMLDFMAPTLQIQQVVLEDLEDDFYFAKAQKVDRCTTCHLAIDRKGFEDAPQPFRTHPEIDLFLGAYSPHPLEKIGCTVCHGGNGHSLTFVHTAHTPRNEEQKKEWEKKYHWHELEKWEKKMLPLQYAQASCAKCHQGTLDVPKAPKLNEGRSLARQYGCFGCHTVKGFESQWKAGPSLLNVKSKLEQEWIENGLQSPKAFRPSTQMPSVFHLENTNLPEDRSRSNVAIAGIASYLMNNSETVELESARMKGNPEVGKKLVEEVGCLGCHSIDDKKVNNHGPELIHLGSKVKPEWLFTWLKNPTHYSKTARMPNLRLTDEEAAHIASFLLQSRNQKFDAAEVPEVSEKEVDEFVFDYLSRKMRQSEARAEIAKMNLGKKFEFVGREMVLQQGCFGCHEIRGFETTKPIGTELTKEGQKEIDKLYFGFVDIEHTRHDWFFQKLKHPRSFDRGKIVAYHERLRMPEFGFTDEQAGALTTFLLSLREEDIPLEMQKTLDLKERAIERGRFLVTKVNCQRCQSLDGVEGRARALFDDKGIAPPILDGEGAKVQEEWLFRFLKLPSAIRPWLKYRMPTFGFSDEETDTVVHYFSNLSDQELSFSPVELGEVSAEEIVAGRELFIKFKCIQCHQPGEAQPGLTASFLAPDLTMSRSRLKPNWVVEWLKDPQVIQPGTMMPTFFSEGQTPVKDILDGDTMKQIRAIKEYLWVFTPEEASGVKSAMSS